jgi:ATP-dependent Clp protease ATP-binding subunit ClpA
MTRVIQEHVKRPLAEELLFGKLSGGGHVRVEVAPGGEGLALIAEPTTRELEHLPESAEPASGGRSAPRKPPAPGRENGDAQRDFLEKTRKLIESGGGEIAGRKDESDG